jgi:hypothetical protein
VSCGASVSMYRWAADRDFVSSEGNRFRNEKGGSKQRGMLALGTVRGAHSGFVEWAEYLPVRSPKPILSPFEPLRCGARSARPSQPTCTRSNLRPEGIVMVCYN